MDTPISDTKQAPPSWRTPSVIIATAVLGCNLIWYYLNIRHWENPQEHIVAIAVNIVMTLALSGALVYALVLNLRDIGREKKLRVAMQRQEKNHKAELEYACADKMRTFEQKLKATQSALVMAGWATLLAEDALWLFNQLREILSSNDASEHPLDLSHPLRLGLISLDMSQEAEPLPWQRLRLLSFRDRCTAHKRHLLDRSLSNMPFAKQAIPNELEADAILTILAEHKSALSDRARELAAPYREIAEILDEIRIRENVMPEVL
jgi:hypothetical protein